MIKQCKKCGSKNLYLEPRIKGQDVMTADMVALKCKDCGSWLKWCPKNERQFYINKSEDIKVEEFWIIQREDEMYAHYQYVPVYNNDTFIFNKSIRFALFYNSKDEAIDCIKTYKLKNCRPVKVKISIVGEDDE